MPKSETHASVLSAALHGLEYQRQRIEDHIATLRSMMSGSTVPSSPATFDARSRPRRRFSAATRRKMALAQRRRYASMRGQAAVEHPETQTPSRKSTKPKKRTLSPEAIERIRAGVRKRIAAQRKQAAAAAKKTAMAKKTVPANKSATAAKAARSKAVKRAAPKARAKSAEAAAAAT